jgi:PAS domain S-box-containing protein
MKITTNALANSAVRFGQQTVEFLATDDSHLLRFFDLSPDLLCIGRFDDSPFLRINRSWSMLGWSEQDLLSRPWLDFVHPDDRRVTAIATSQLLGGAGEQQFSNRFRCSDGSYRWLDWRAYPQQDTGVVYAIARDTTESKRREEEVQSHRERLRAVFDAMEEGMVVQAMDTSIVECNAAAERIMGFSSKELKGTSSSDPRWTTIHEDGSPFPWEEHPPLQAIRTGQRQRDVVLGLCKQDGSITWLSANSVPLIDTQGRQYGVLSTFSDVTNRLRLESQLRQAHKMEAIGTLAGGIAHDFNNILAAVQGYTQLAKADTEHLTEVQMYLDAVLQGMKRASGLVNQITTFTRMTSVEPVPLRLEEVVNEAMALLRSTIPATYAINLELAKDLPAVLAEPTQMHQVVLNLVTNAWHAMRSKNTGRIDVRLECVEVDSVLTKRLSESISGKHVKLSVIDTGQGIDQSTLRRIFEPFFTTKAPGAGTGLGLAVVHGIVKGHHGAIHVHSQIGTGTTFEIYLPVSAVEARDHFDEVEASYTGDGQQILLVDDEAPLLNYCATALRRIGYAVSAYSDPTEALTAFQAEPNRFEVVVTDFAMPELSGMALAEQLRATRAHVPIIVVSGFIEDSLREQAAALDIDWLIAKPYSLNALARSLQQITKQSAHRT